MTVDVAVIGGGISGLATAHDLKQRGHRVVVLERQTKPGGNAVSERRSGFLMEHGPSTMNALVPAANQISQTLGIDDFRCDLGDGIQKRYLVAKGGLAGIPVRATGFLTANYLSPLAKLRVLAEFLVPHSGDCGENDDDETVMDFCVRRFGREFAERVMDPMVAGIYGGGRAAELSMGAIFPMLLALEKKYGSVTLGIMHRAREGGKMPGSRLFSWRDGIATLADAFTRDLGADISTGVTVRRLSRTAGGFEIQLGAAGRLRTRSVVIATQAHVATKLLAGLDPDGAAAAEQIQAPPMAVVFLGYHRSKVEHPLDGLGFLTAEDEGRQILGSQFCSTMFPGRAPRDHVAVSAYIGGVRAPDLGRLPAPDLIELARAEFRDLIGAKGEPAVAMVRHWPVGLPQYNVGHRQRINVLQQSHQRHAGLYLTGNYLAGPSVAVCVGVAQKTAQSVHAYLAKGVESHFRQSAI